MEDLIYTAAEAWHHSFYLSSVNVWKKLDVPLLFILATFNVTLNIFKHSYVLPISYFIFIQSIFNPRYYVAGQIKTDRKFPTVYTHTCPPDAILFKEEFATKR